MVNRNKMIKPRAPSDPTALTSDPSYGAYGQPQSSTPPARPPRPQRSATLPTRVPPELRSAEPFPTISASMILGMDVSHSGWVRKEGNRHRSWKSRFMVLHHGCLYYFRETDSNAPKGKFALNGYRCLSAPDRVDRYPYIFKLVPDDEEHRTYFISSPSKSEMEGWMNSITADIRTYCPSDYDYVDVEACEVGQTATCPTVPKDIPTVQLRVPGLANSDRFHSHSFPKSGFIGKPTPLLPPRPDVTQKDYNPEEEEVYETVDFHTSLDEQHYTPVLNDEPDGSKRPSMRPNEGRPLPPVRPTPPPRPKDMVDEDSESDDDESDDDALYVELNKKRTAAAQSPTSPERERPIPPIPVQNGSDISDGEEDEITYLPVIGNEEFQEILRKNEQNSEKQPKPPPRPMPKPPPRPAREEKKEFDYLPLDCFKPDMPKTQAKIFLELGRTVGQYIINASQSSDTKMSLSVWLGTGVKHYLIFKRQEMLSLDPSLAEEQFKDLRQLVKYYYSHALPKSGRYLTGPFAS